MKTAKVLFSCAVALFLQSACNSSTLGGDPDLGVVEDPPKNVFEVQPAALQTVTVTMGQQAQSVGYTATLDGQPCSTVWSVDRGDVGYVNPGPAADTQFNARGTVGGLVTVKATCSGQTLTRQVQVVLSGQQNGANPSIPSQAGQIPKGVGDLTSGGGVGGVGGEGLGGAVTDQATIDALNAPTGDGSAQALTFLYPYNATVWPRGMLAPLLQWRWSFGDADAIKIELSNTSGSFKWSGSFGRPAILATTKGPFIRHPIPQDVWEMATNSAGGKTASGTPEQLTVKVTLARGGVGYGPITETWGVATARLTGTIYYQSYGTLLAKNYSGAVGGDKMFGGAVLSIRVGDLGPKLLAGANGGTAQCRTCHSVASQGARLISQRGDNYGVSAGYTITPTGTSEATLSTGATFPGLYPDGTFALSPTGALLQMPTATQSFAIQGLAAIASSLGTPAFGPAGDLLVINPMVSSSITSPTQKLVALNYSAANKSVSNPVVIADYSKLSAENRPGWAAVFPDGKSVIFQHQLKAGIDGASGELHTRKGAQGEIAWTTTTDANSVALLKQLNGRNADGSVYLPKLLAPSTLACTGDGSAVAAGSGMDVDHSTDPILNYEPTVLPVATGGYAWVVFVSRRMYGNVAAIPPYCSDPRGVDLVQNITTKKLWVAAVDLNAAPGTDPSHPAFYLPAQEILAGNSRGYWVLDPCRSDGNSCQSGDQCCGGYCNPNATGDLVCGSTSGSQCSSVQEKCTTVADCCDSRNLCLNGFCAEHISG
ncbi:MAG TPA: hypothetical protein PKE31_18730 [Pseudomonadota bacterium]|nr:hypothetical protein [Pseudomonadota bacterium]